MWTARRIIKELADSDRRRRILVAFWRFGDDTAKMLAVTQLAKALHFREESIRKLPVEKKADLFASRASGPEFEQSLDAALMHYHTHEQSALLAAFLDQWKIPHVNGSIESDEYAAPSEEQVRAAVTAVDSFPPRDVAIYLASAGLLMGDEWRAATWPVVDELAAELGNA
ncbi:MAG: hypothetical protein QOC81_1175 [Thermoanaerobaculia bacterium]|jgi:hypothetical protein|nr:hypothetical protein [Thermoanaerobaculia bacterium]